VPYATDSDLTTRIPATSAATEAQRAFALDDAEEQIDLESYAGRAVRAHVFLAAHYLALSGAIPGGGESGLVRSHAMGAISASYAVTALSASDSLLGTTIYGRQFLQIRASVSSWPEIG
jgi:hypothetical protein